MANNGWFDLARKPSPNVNSRHGALPRGIVVHYTGGPSGWAAQWFQNPASRVSAHFVIARGGKITQCANIYSRAWHAGISEMRDPSGEMRSDPNTWTIGVEFENWGYILERHGKLWVQSGREIGEYRGPHPKAAAMQFRGAHKVEGLWEPYTEEQRESFRVLLNMLDEVGMVDCTENIWGHCEIAMPLGRKLDPGPLWFWDEWPANRIDSELLPWNNT